MQAQLKISCNACGKKLGLPVVIDTADMPEQLQSKVNGVILAHRTDCPYYGLAERKHKAKTR